MPACGGSIQIETVCLDREAAGSLGAASISRSGDEIRTQETEFATLVTIDVENIPDAREVTATLFLPRMVVQQGQSAALATIGVLTTSARRIEGQMQTYRVLNLSGTASAVAF